LRLSWARRSPPDASRHHFLQSNDTKAFRLSKSFTLFERATKLCD
jgi:hypothetical protein